MNIPLQHTFSSLGMFETCPWRWYQVRHVKRWSDEMGEAARIGDQGHKALEARLKHGEPLPSGWNWLEPMASTVHQQIVQAGMSMHIEQKVAINRNWQPCDYYAKDYMIRGKIDLLALGTDRAVVDDFKFGKRKLTNQLKLYAGMIMTANPAIQKVKTQFLWVHEPQFNDSEYFSRADLPQIAQEFNGKIIQIEQAVTQNIFVKRPSGLCRKHCPVFDCEHNGRRTS